MRYLFLVVCVYLLTLYANRMQIIKLA